MDQENLRKFIQRIIVTSIDSHQSACALKELESILQSQGVPETHLALIETAVQGVTDSIGTMKASISSLPTLSANDLETAAERAHAAKLREEEARRNGRC